jgi:hypothetical protein
MFDVGLCDVLGSIPVGGVYFSTPIWHHFSYARVNCIFLAYLSYEFVNSPQV